MRGFCMKKFILHFLEGQEVDGPFYELDEEKYELEDRVVENGKKRHLGVLNNTRKSGVDFDFDIPLLSAIGYVASHNIPCVYVYQEEAQNLKEGTWYPYKVYFPTPMGWLKVDGSRFSLIGDVGLSLAPVETKHVLREWGISNVAMLKMLGLYAPEN